MGKWLLRIIQRQDAIRTSGWGNLLFSIGGKDHNRALESSLQHDQTPQQPRWATSSSANFSTNTQTTCEGFINTVGGSKTPGWSGSPASIVINPNIIKEIFNNIPTEMQGSAINFIIGHEIGHLIVESVRTNEIGSFEKANTEEFYGKVKHHQLVDAVGMNLANLSWEETLKILKYFPNEGDFSDRIYCLEHL